MVPPEGRFHQTLQFERRTRALFGVKDAESQYKLQPGKIQSDVPLAYGGWQIEYEEEDPIIRKLFEEECAKSGAEVNMPPVGTR